MILYIDENRKIKSYSMNDESFKPIKGYAELYDGKFSFFMGDYSEGKTKEFYLNEDSTIRIEYIDKQHTPEPQLTETEQAILDTAINVDYLVCMKELEI